VREVRREFSRILSPETPQSVLDFARLLLSRQDPILRFVAYELVSPGLFANWHASIKRRLGVFSTRTGRSLLHGSCGRLDAS
jgi:hypothetical protein